MVMKLCCGSNNSIDQESGDVPKEFSKFEWHSSAKKSKWYIVTTGESRKLIRGEGIYKYSYHFHIFTQ